VKEKLKALTIVNVGLELTSDSGCIINGFGLRQEFAEQLGIDIKPSERGAVFFSSDSMYYGGVRAHSVACHADVILHTAGENKLLAEFLPIFWVDRNVYDMPKSGEFKTLDGENFYRTSEIPGRSMDCCTLESMPRNGIVGVDTEKGRTLRKISPINENGKRYTHYISPYVDGACEPLITVDFGSLDKPTSR